MYRWLLVALAGYIIYRMFKNDAKAKAEQRGRDEAARHESGAMARDPVCGTFVEMEEAITVRNGNKIYHFCGYDCRDAFLKRLQAGESAESIEAASHSARSKDKDDETPPSTNGEHS